MKLDKIRFAKVVSWISRMTNGLEFAEDDLIELDNIIEINIPNVVVAQVNPSQIDELLRELVNPEGHIAAIKAYRSLTGSGLKESKEAIEKYRSFKEPATLSDILKQANN